MVDFLGMNIADSGYSVKIWQIDTKFNANTAYPEIYTSKMFAKKHTKQINKQYITKSEQMSIQ